MTMPFEVGCLTTTAGTIRAILCLAAPPGREQIISDRLLSKLAHAVEHEGPRLGNDPVLVIFDVDEARLFFELRAVVLGTRNTFERLTATLWQSEPLNLPTLRQLRMRKRCLGN